MNFEFLYFRLDYARNRLRLEPMNSPRKGNYLKTEIDPFVVKKLSNLMSQKIKILFCHLFC